MTESLEPSLSHLQFIEMETAIIDKKNELYKATLVLAKGTHLFHDWMFHVTGLKVIKSTDISITITINAVFIL